MSCLLAWTPGGTQEEDYFKLDQSLFPIKSRVQVSENTMTSLQSGYHGFPFYRRIYNSHEHMKTEEPVLVFIFIMTLRIHLILHTLVA